ncbi:ThuA domain-containing protein [Colwellia echini]|uniref:ThuA domain-containing protein n=1 Tax=Colwellia echini TaxID=1982103 RepID=A0ABY3N173_9GAMM|nr:ThuA domain-containing protein [Colwellia echini]TYK67246.1 ThuA domain-containing protein [Colwellia echini]
MNLLKNTWRALILLFVVMLSNNVSAKQFNALLFTKTDGWHHSSVLEGVSAIKKIAQTHHFDVSWQEDAAQFNTDNLAKYDVVIFLLTTGDVLNAKQQQAFKAFIQQGKGFVGIHSAADTELEWSWYKELVGRTFVIHPAIQTAKVSVINKDFPGVEQMPSTFLWTDEYYQYSKPHSDKLNYILSVDEDTYSPDADWGEVKSDGMGDFHPMAWFQNYDGGRSFYSGLGHLPENYSQPMFLSHLYGGIYWAATGKGL